MAMFFFVVVVVVGVRSFIILEIFANANMQRKYINQPDTRSRAKMTESKLFQWPGTCEWALRNLIPFSTAIEAFMSERASTRSVQHHGAILYVFV